MPHRLRSDAGGNLDAVACQRFAVSLTMIVARTAGRLAGCIGI